MLPDGGPGWPVQGDGDLGLSSMSMGPQDLRGDGWWDGSPGRKLLWSATWAASFSH